MSKKMMIKKMMKKTKGFTLTELIVVITILGVLAAIAVPLLTGYIEDSEIKADEANAKIIEGAIKRKLADRTLTDSNFAANVITEVKEELKEIPDVNQDGKEFFAEIDTGDVVVATVAPVADEWVEIIE